MGWRLTMLKTGWPLSARSLNASMMSVTSSSEIKFIFCPVPTAIRILLSRSPDSSINRLRQKQAQTT
jgi:hypothetical protein